ncbi:ATP-binding cassette domain-containing protein [Providencia manganoxydans]|uniref:ATP-binding cassette domain-containing protein n=1 Tax=Providencia manganoxydans TaxID=2923283 RepID=UPI0029C0F487|nr:ATP-binding cassette domain-containing protein [Providencia manganoxydans]MDX4945431.1 ATP-binding cassette domain-containing protein [Providencia manganoxydans]
MENNRDIKLFGAKEHNLKNIDIVIPINKITCVVGKSGSGKSSLVEGIIAKESQRLEKIVSGNASEYDRFVRPDFNQIINLPNSISVNQSLIMRTESSNVATYSGLNKILRALFVSKGQIVCSCNECVDSTVSKNMITSLLEKLLDNDSIYEFHYLLNKNNQININQLKKFSENHSIDEFLVDNQKRIFHLTDLLKISPLKKITIKAIIGSANRDNVSELRLHNYDIKNLQVVKNNIKIIDFKYDTFCYQCYSKYQSKSISLFTRKLLSSHSGCCLSCNGKGLIKKINYNKLISRNKNITDNTFINIENNGKAYKYINLQNKNLLAFYKKNISSHDVTFDGLNEEEQHKILSFLDKILTDYNEHEKLQSLFINIPCKDCRGTGFNNNALSVLYKGKNISDMLRMTISEASSFFSEIDLNRILISLTKLSLGHISLDRSTSTLSGGELQRLKLLEIILERNEPLLLIIDEPSLGLHHKDIERLFSLFRDLTSSRNTLLIVDHNPWIISHSDKVITLGPKSGKQGGFLISNDVFNKNKNQIGIRKKSYDFSDKLSFNNININNIKNQSVIIPLFQMTSLVGISGSGKSTLAEYIANNSSLYFEKIIHLNQFPIGKNKRSTIATYLDISDLIRKIFSQTKNAKSLGLTKSDFTGNSPIGACKICSGLGDINGIECYGCNGKKLNPFILSIDIDGFNINDILQFSIDDLIVMVPSLYGHKKLYNIFTILTQLGLGHLNLGREIPFISGGEAQRVKLAKYLSTYHTEITNKKSHNLLILDEPSQGLNISDSRVVAKLLKKLLTYNNSILIIEHNDILIKESDYIIEIGPYAGKLGGEIIFSGTPYDYFNKINKFKNQVFEQDKLLENNNLYPSALTNNNIDTSYFTELNKNYNNYCLKSNEDDILFFSNKEELIHHYLSHYKSSSIYFNPFASLFINSPLISKVEISSIILNLKKFQLNRVYINCEQYHLDSASKIINNTNCWNTFVEVDDINQAFELGSGWVVIYDLKGYKHLSVPLLSLNEKIFFRPVTSSKHINLFYNQCQYCSGTGMVTISDEIIQNSNLTIFDANFYTNHISNIFKSKLSRKLDLIMSTFSNQGLFNFNKPFIEFTDQEIIMFDQGLANHKFIKRNGRINAKSDTISWSGMTSFIMDNLKYFSEKDKNKFITSLMKKKCQVCAGNKYNRQLNYYYSKNQKEKNC